MADSVLAALGWRHWFARQIAARERLHVPARVMGVWRRSLSVRDEIGETEQHLGGRWFRGDPAERPTVGDWVLLQPDRRAIVRRLERDNLLERRAAGRVHERQPMAANVDVMLLVSACNEEFNPSRLERFLALALDARVEPVIVLTKADLTADVAPYLTAAAALKRDLPVHAVDARDTASVADLHDRLGAGRTAALLGASGVGKSTLVNTLLGSQRQATGAVRAADDKGRHTTTHRSLHLLPNGGLLLDSPGLRELTLADVQAGVDALFDDITELASRCRFANCRHDREPDCAVQVAVAAGALDGRRLANWRKLGS